MHPQISPVVAAWGRGPGRDCRGRVPSAGHDDAGGGAAAAAAVASSSTNVLVACELPAAHLAQELQQRHGAARCPHGIVAGGVLPPLRIAGRLRGVDVHDQPALQRFRPPDRRRHVHAPLRHRRLRPVVRPERCVRRDRRGRSMATRAAPAAPAALGAATDPQRPGLPVPAGMARHRRGSDAPGRASRVPGLSPLPRGQPGGPERWVAPRQQSRPRALAGSRNGADDPHGTV